MHAEFLADRAGLFAVRIAGGDGMKLAEHLFASGREKRDQGFGAAVACFGRVWDSARKKHSSARLGGNFFIAHNEIHVSFHNVENRIFLGMEMRRNSGSRPIALLDQRKNAARLGTIEFEDLVVANNIEMLPVARKDENRR